VTLTEKALKSIVKLNKARLHMTRLNLSPSLLSQLDRKSLSYNFKDWDSSVWLLHKDIKHRTLPTTMLKKWPRRVVLVMYDEDSDVDSTKNPFYFRHNKVRDITLDISGVKFARNGMKWDFAGRDYNVTSVYYETVNSSGGINDFPFNFRDFVEIYSIFVFDVTNSRYAHAYARTGKGSLCSYVYYKCVSFVEIRHCVIFKACRTVPRHSAWS
jgi:hypothetical protein